jgi:hypothetical protein
VRIDLAPEHPESQPRLIPAPPAAPVIEGAPPLQPRFERAAARTFPTQPSIPSLSPDIDVAETYVTSSFPPSLRPQNSHSVEAGASDEPGFSPIETPRSIAEEVIAPASDRPDRFDVREPESSGMVRVAPVVELTGELASSAPSRAIPAARRSLDEPREEAPNSTVRMFG